MERSQDYRIAPLWREGSFETARFLIEDLTTLHSYDFDEENHRSMDTDPKLGAVFMQFADIKNDDDILAFARRFGLLVPMRRKPSTGQRLLAANPEVENVLLPDIDELGEKDPRFPDWESLRPSYCEEPRTRAGVNDTTVAEPVSIWYERVGIMQGIVNAPDDEIRAFLLGREATQLVASRSVFLKDGRIAWRWKYLTLWDALITQMIDSLSDYRFARCGNTRCQRTFLTTHQNGKYCCPKCQDAQKSRRHRRKPKSSSDMKE